MRPPDEVRREILESWLRRANEDLSLATHLLEDESLFLNAIGFHAQQAAEKYLKAYLVSLDADFPRTHSIEHLLRLASCSSPDLLETLRPAITLTDFGVSARYPGDLPELTRDQAIEAVAIAQRVRDEIMAALEYFRS